jgi:hypothetical protein
MPSPRRLKPAAFINPQTAVWLSLRDEATRSIDVDWLYWKATYPGVQHVYTTARRSLPPHSLATCASACFRPVDVAAFSSALSRDGDARGRTDQSRAKWKV